jgi:hypothetical protein
MFGQTRRVLGALAGTTAVTLAVGVGVGTGLVPRPNAPGSVTSQPAAAPVVQAVAPAVVEVTPETTVVTAPPPTAPPTTAAPRVTAPPSTKAATTQAAAVEPAAVAAPAPPPVASGPTPRRVPSAAEVQQVIAGISSMVQLPLFFQITPAHVADIGNRICTAFDEGQTFAQVKATGLSMVSRYVVVSPAAADYAVRQAVALYCPAHGSKLV